jgi:hypothetical protein
MPEPSTPHIGKEVALVAPDSSFRVHIAQNPLDSRNDTQLLRNMNLHSEETEVNPKESFGFQSQV